MAIESKRGCGYRKVGGLYLVSGEFSMGCDRLPFQLDICPCCGGGIKQSRGTTWIQPVDLFEGDHPTTNYYRNPETGKDEPLASYNCTCLTHNPHCPVCFPSKVFVDVSFDEKTGETIEDLHGKALLLWIGKAHYKTPQAFIAEGLGQGISRRINSIPRDFKLGKTWVFLAHPEAIWSPLINLDDADGPEYEPGIFSAFMPTRIERLVKHSDYDAWEYADNPKQGLYRQTNPEQAEKMWSAWLEDVYIKIEREIYEKLQRDIDRGITLVPVPDDDPDHNPEGK